MIYIVVVTEAKRWKELHAFKAKERAMKLADHLVSKLPSGGGTVRESPKDPSKPALVYHFSNSQGDGVDVLREYLA